jgi:hypothetical protein
MATATPTKPAPKPLRLNLPPNGVLPAGLTWLIHDGYLRTTTWDDNDAETIALLRQQIRNTEEIFEINRIRSAERRLLMLLRWLGVRFGQVNSSGLTRVTVTKNLNRYKTIGLLQSVSEADLLIPNQFLAAAC